MLSRLYGVDDPATLTASAFTVTAPGASASTSVVVGAGSVKVELDGITFSKRRLRIHGEHDAALREEPPRRADVDVDGAHRIHEGEAARLEGARLQGDLPRGQPRGHGVLDEEPLADSRLGPSLRHELHVHAAREEQGRSRQDLGQDQDSRALGGLRLSRSSTKFGRPDGPLDEREETDVSEAPEAPAGRDYAELG